MPKTNTLTKALTASALIYILLAGLLIWRVPLRSAPDEKAHWDYVAYVAEHHSFPIFKITKAPDYGYEFHQPPLYYVLNAPLWSAFHGSDAARYATRIFSLICGLLTILVLWSALKVLFPDRPIITTLSTFFVALWPVHLAVGASGGNDALTGLMCALMLWILVRASKSGWQWRHSLWLGVIVGLGILTKSSTLPVAFAALAGMIHLLWKESKLPDGKSTFAASLGKVITTIIIAAAIGGPWLLRNQLLYGDPLAMGVFNLAFSQSSLGPKQFFAAGFGIVTYLRALLSITFSTFWGLFGGPNTAIKALNPFGETGPKVTALWALPLILIFLSTTVFSLWGLVRKIQNGIAKSTFRGVVLTWWMVAFALTFLAWVEFNTYQFQGQSRYLYPAVLPIVAGLCYGWTNIWGDKNKKLTLASALVGLCMLIATLWNILGWRTLV